MPVENRIVKVRKRNRSLVRFDPDRIHNAILSAGTAVGGFHRDRVPGINDRIFQSGASDESIADFLTDAVNLCLNSNPYHLTANFPPTIEVIQDEVLHVLRSHGLQRTAEAYACYRWSRHWLREGDITQEQFVGNGLESEALRNSLQWNQEHGCDTVSGLNEIVQGGQLKGLIEADTARYESQLAATVESMLTRLNSNPPIRLIWIAGPTSSGKTTTTVKLTQRLEQHGVRFMMLNLDDYFLPLVEHPTDWIDDRNYETPEALDIQLINEHLKTLLAGKPIEKPVFSFKQGRRTTTQTVRLETDQVLLLDCLHGLYPPLTEEIDPQLHFNVCVDAANGLYEADGSSRRLVLNGDVRMLRRMLRDSQHRNTSPLFTLLHWHYVRGGELFSIVPFAGKADGVINAGSPYDLPVMHPLLTGSNGALPSQEDLKDYPGFLDARIRLDRIQQLLARVSGVEPSQLTDLNFIPGDAVVREFIGGSTVKIPHNE